MRAAARHPQPEVAMSMKIALSTFAATMLLSATPAFAAVASSDLPRGEAAPAQASGPMAEGEVRKVDTDTKKITLTHGEIRNLDMPSMTMVFQVKDPALLDAVREGDKVKFRAEKSGSSYVVTEMAPGR